MKKLLLLSLALITTGSIFGYSVTVQNNSKEKVTCWIGGINSSNGSSIQITKMISPSQSKILNAPGMQHDGQQTLRCAVKDQDNLSVETIKGAYDGASLIWTGKKIEMN